MKRVKEDWNSTARAYEIFQNSPDSYCANIEWPCVQEMLPDIKNKVVLDLGCGTGIFTFLLEQYSPSALVGIDLSDEMLKIAADKADENRSIARFIQGDASKAASYTDGEYDLIFSSTMTHYIQDLDALFANISKCLRTGGMCILSVIHPVYSALYPIEHGDVFPNDGEWTVRYLDKRTRAYIQPWIEYNDDFENRLSRSFHHTFGDYVNAVVKAGLRLEEIREPLPPERWKQETYDRYDNYIQTPTCMVLKIIK